MAKRPGGALPARCLWPDARTPAPHQIEDMPFSRFIYRHRLLGKRLIGALSRALPRVASRRLRALAEKVAFSLTPQYQGDTLPPIFSYWSGRHLAPDAKRLGIDSPESFYLHRILEACAQRPSTLRVLSAGAGAASMEMALVGQLKSAGARVQFTCMDFNPRLVRQATDAAESMGISDAISFLVQDCNRPFVHPLQDVIIVNQFFHHVTELETFCRSLRESLAPQGMLLSSDIIGRNGHLLWPDIEQQVQHAWESLPPRQRYDRHFHSIQRRYRMVNHAAYSNEGIRAQDVVECLLAEFRFELFFTFGAAIVPFVERRIGFNFDGDKEEDRALIDRIQALDKDALMAGQYPATNMIAALRHKGPGNGVYQPISPELHVELTRQQKAKTNDRGGRRHPAE